MTSPTTTDRISDVELVVTREFDAPARIVFEAWRRPDLFQRWWTPESFGIKVISCELDMRTGGSYRLVLSHPAAPEPMTFFGRYTEVVPPTKIVWTNEEDPNGPITTATIEEKDGKSTLTLSERYPSKEALDESLATGASGTGAAPEQFSQLELVLRELA